MALKILTFNWHEGYIHLLAKTGYEFDIVERWKGGRYGWIKEFRPVPSNCCLISEDEAKIRLEAGDYDRIIAHNLHDFTLVSETPIPKVLLHHNKIAVETNIFDKSRQEELLQKLRDMYGRTKNLTLVFVSQAKRDDWRLGGEVILPGIDIAEYGGYTGNTKKVLRVGNGLQLRDIMLGYSMQEKILNGLPSTILGLNPDILISHLPKDWEELKDFMKSHRVFLNTTVAPYEDGYNLAMLEAMATGMPIVSIANTTSPVEDGINGFISSDENYLHSKIKELLQDLQMAKSLGGNARETVMEKFPLQRFIYEWKRVLGDSSYKVKTHDPYNQRDTTEVEKKKIVLSYTSNPQTTAAYIERALRKHYDVITYGPKISDDIFGIDVLKEWKLEALKDRLKDHDIPYFSSDIKTILQVLPKGWIPDLFLWVESGAWYPMEGLEQMPCPTACYLIDVHLGLEKRIEMAKRFDYVFIAQKEYLSSFKDAGVKRVFWLPLACDPEIHGKKTEEKIYDIGFVGSLNNPKRIELLNVLKQRFNLYYERCFLERMAEVFSRSKIIFNNSVNNDLNMRVLEALCSGSMLLTDEAKGSGLSELFHDKRHLIIYRDKEELIELADYYLRNDEERERIAEEGMKEVLNRHTYEHRVKEMMEIISLFSDKRKTEDSEQVFDNHPEALVLQPYCIGRGIDVGCGFRKTHPDAIGVDIIGKGEVGEYGCMKGMQSVAEIKASGDNLSMFKDGELDYVVNRHNLEHYVDIAKTLKEWKRVLKEGGILGMVLPDESKINTIALDPTHKHAFTPESIKNLLELIGGFDIEKIEPVIEKWSFVVIARKAGKNKNVQEANTSSLEKVVSHIALSGSVKNSDYYSQERKDIDALIPEGTMRILDVGCGEGILGKRLLDKGAKEVIGIEINPQIYERAIENLSAIICSNIEELEPPFDKGYFDCIIFADILEHLRDPLSVLKKLKDYLSDSGVVVASIPNVRYYGVINMLVEGRWKYEDYGILDKTHLRFFTKKEIESLFNEAGLEIIGINENIDPTYYNLNDPLSGEISFGRVSLKGLSPEELKDIFVGQYLIKAQKAGHEIQKVHDTVKSAFESGNLEEAKRAFEEYLDLHPADTDILYGHADVCNKLGLLDKAIESLERLLIFEPERVNAHDLRKKIKETILKL